MPLPSFITNPRIPVRESRISDSVPITGLATAAQRKRMAAADARAAAKAPKKPRQRPVVRSQAAALAAGAQSYRRDDGVLMVETTPNVYVAHHVANDNTAAAVAA